MLNQLYLTIFEINKRSNHVVLELMLVVATILLVIATLVIFYVNRQQLNAKIFKDRYTLYEKIMDYVTSDDQVYKWDKISSDSIR